MAVGDMTENAAQTNDVARGEALLSSVLATAPDAIITMDATGMVTAFSAAAERMFGYPVGDVIGRNVSMLMLGPDHSHHDGYLDRYRITGSSQVIGRRRRVLARRRDGVEIAAEVTIGEADVAGERVFIGFLRDLSVQEATEAKLDRLRAELFQVSRLTAMGTMASTLAHELNQPLTVIANYLETTRAMLAESGDADRAIIESIDAAASEALRAGEIIRHLRAFVMKGELTRSIESLPELAEEAVTLALSGVHQIAITRRIDFAPDVPAVLIDRVQLQQALLILMRNAIAAMEGMENACIAIVGRHHRQCVHIQVIDSGPGLAPDVKEALFDAFVTTKHEGMGLGLSICRTIIEAHGGKLWADTHRTSGAMFEFSIPVGGQLA